MRGTFPRQRLESLHGTLVVFPPVLVDVHIQMYTHDVRVGKLSDQGTESSM